MAVELIELNFSEDENNNCQKIVDFIFQSNFNVRTIINKDDFYFSAKDLCAILDIKDHKQTYERLNPKYMYRFDVIDRQNHLQHNAVFVSEPGLYQLIFSSQKAEAREFQEWVFEEVLPSIRKTGSYTMDYVNSHDELCRYIKERCAIGEGNKVGCNDFEIDYKAWCFENNIKPMSEGQLRYRMKKLGLNIKLDFNQPVHGIKIIPKLQGIKYYKSIRPQDADKLIRE